MVKIEGLNFPKITDSHTQEPANQNVPRNEGAQMAEGLEGHFKELGDIFLGRDGLSPDFIKVYETAIHSSPLSSKIQEQKNAYSGWSREDIKRFVNNPNNLIHFQNKPALVVALYEILIGG